MSEVKNMFNGNAHLLVHQWELLDLVMLIGYMIRLPQIARHYSADPVVRSNCCQTPSAS